FTSSDSYSGAGSSTGSIGAILTVRGSSTSSSTNSSSSQYTAQSSGTYSGDALVSYTNYWDGAFASGSYNLGSAVHRGSGNGTTTSSESAIGTYSGSGTTTQSGSRPDGTASYSYGASLLTATTNSSRSGTDSDSYTNFVSSSFNSLALDGYTE